SKFRCDLAVRVESEGMYKLGILVDTDSHYANPNLLERYLMQPSILTAFGWRYLIVLTKDWFHNPEDVLNRIEKTLRGEDLTEEVELPDEEPLPPEPETPPSIPAPPVISPPPKANVPPPPVSPPPVSNQPGSTR